MAKPSKSLAPAPKGVLVEVVERLTGRVVARHGPYRAALVARLERAIAKDLDRDRYYTRQVENAVIH